MNGVTHVAVYLADQNPHRDRSLGISAVTRCLLQDLLAFDEIELSTIRSTTSISFHGPQRRELKLPWPTDRRLGRLLADHLHPWICSVGMAPDVWFYPKGYLSLLARPRGRVVLTVHDLIVQFYADRYPEFRSRWDYGYWIALSKASIRKADAICADSDNGKRQILTFCDRHDIPVPRVYVTYVGSPMEEFDISVPVVKEDFVLHLASCAPHKRTDHLLRWWREMQPGFKDSPRLRLIGSLSDEGRRLVDSMENVSIQSHLQEAEFLKLMRKARALILPSEIEGFGLPAIEAYYLGTPVCFVNETAVAEIIESQTSVGGFSLESSESFGHALDQVLQLDATEVQRVSSGLKQKYSRRAAAEAVANVLGGISA